MALFAHCFLSQDEENRRLLAALLSEEPTVDELTHPGLVLKQTHKVRALICVRLRVPCLYPSPHAFAAHAEVALFRVQAVTDKLLVLSCDDNCLQQRVAEMICARLGHAVACATSAEAALRFLIESPTLPDVILLDIVSFPGHRPPRPARLAVCPPLCVDPT